MINIALLGKKYQDYIFYLEDMSIGETNISQEPEKVLGGCHNMLAVTADNVKFQIFTVGSKDAYIISESGTSTRTSIVINKSVSNYNDSIIDNINANYTWAHVCYIDDLERPEQLLDLSIDFSIDFCTLKPRHEFADIINKAKVVFDSRERKHLYQEVYSKTPIIFHDQYGIEVNADKDILFESSIDPVPNLNVNGAGDMYAANFIKNYHTYGIIKSANMAMISTTHLLKKRIKQTNG